MRPSATLRFGVVYMKKGHETKAQMGAAMQATIRIRDVGGSFFFFEQVCEEESFWPGIQPWAPWLCLWCGRCRAARSAVDLRRLVSSVNANVDRSLVAGKRRLGDICVAFHAQW